jgi:glycosyltransferase involved in cell wall biosynthesis
MRDVRTGHREGKDAERASAYAASANPTNLDPPSKSLARVSVVIPTLNEAGNIASALATIPDDVHEIILVDGGLVDATVDIAFAARPGIRVLYQSGRGKGDALVCGFAACRGDIIVTLDADGSTDGSEIPRFVEALLAGADYAKGSRFTEGGGSSDITSARRIGNRFLCGVVNRLFGTRYSDLCYGFNAFWKRALGVLHADCDGFEIEALLNVRAAKGRLVVIEVPSFERQRGTGESKLHPIGDGIRVLRTIVRERFDTGPRRERLRAIPCFELPCLQPPPDDSPPF